MEDTPAWTTNCDPSLNWTHTAPLVSCVAQPTFFTKTDFKSCADLGRLEETPVPVAVAVWPSPSTVTVEGLSPGDCVGKAALFTLSLLADACSPLQQLGSTGGADKALGELVLPGFLPTIIGKNEEPLLLFSSSEITDSSDKQIRWPYHREDGLLSSLLL